MEKLKPARVESGVTQSDPHRSWKYKLQEDWKAKILPGKRSRAEQGLESKILVFVVNLTGADFPGSLHVGGRSRIRSTPQSVMLHTLATHKPAKLALELNCLP
jgi:hypothetical protein